MKTHDFFNVVVGGENGVIGSVGVPLKLHFPWNSVDSQYDPLCMIYTPVGSNNGCYCKCVVEGGGLYDGQNFLKEIHNYNGDDIDGGVGDVVY